jgi:hypothetical protein
MADETLENIALKLQKALEEAAPQDTRFVVIYALPNDPDFGLISNIPDEYALDLINSAAESIHNTPPTDMEFLEEEQVKKIN